MPVITSSEWDAYLAKYPNVHLLQTTKWGQLKRQFGWGSECIVEGDAGVQILFKKQPFFTIAYIPKGPVGDRWEALIPSIHQECRKKRAITLLVEPDLWEDRQAHEMQPYLEFRQSGRFRPAIQAIQPRSTLVLDLNQTDTQLLGAMKQKTRYNIRLAEKKGIRVHQSSDMASFANLMQVTGSRDNFSVHQPSYYEKAFKLFEPDGGCALLVAELHGEPLAGLMVFKQGNRAWYLYGASSNHHRELMPAYLLQWTAILWAKDQGCSSYDLWGVPDQDETYLEANFTRREDGLWGVYRFKRGFGGEIKRTVDPVEFDYLPLVCKFYRYLRSKRGAAGGV